MARRRGVASMREFDIYSGEPYIIRKDAELVTTTEYYFDLQQQRFLTYLIGKIQQGDPPNTQYTLTTREYFDISRYYPRKKYSYNELVRGMTDRVRQIEAQQCTLRPFGYPWETFYWFNSRHTIFRNEKPDRPALSIRFDQSVANWLFALKDDPWHTLSYDWYNIALLNNVHALRMYEWLKCCGSRRERTKCTLDAVRKRIGVPPASIDRNAHLWHWILDPCIDALNEYTDIHVEWELWKASSYYWAYTDAVFYVTPLPSEEWEARRQKTIETLRQHPGANKEVMPNGKPYPVPD